MTNHVHLVAIPGHESSLANTLARAHSVYALARNRRESRTGHLWQGRFYSCPLARSHLLNAFRYVDENPVRAGMVECAWDWQWSSARAHCSPGAPDKILDPDWPEYFDCWNYGEWREILRGDENFDTWGELRRATLAGEPFGSQDFVTRMEGNAGRRLRVLPHGRPRKGK